jgi:ribonuclease P protein component
MPTGARLNRFGRTRRILRTRDFGRVYQGCRSAADQYFVVYAAPNAMPASRLGLSVGKRVGNAARRNRVKRLLREAFRTARQLPAGFDFVVVARKDACNAAWETVKLSLVNLALMASNRWET